MPSKGHLGVVVALACLATAGAAGRQTAPPSQPPTTGTCAISGVVTDGATGAPLQGASVLILNVRNAAGQFQDFRHPSAVTDAKGRFVFADLPAALSYDIYASRIGYNAGETIDRVSIALAEGEWKRDVRIVMSRPSSISGRVVDERGEPVVGTTVRIFSRRTVAGRELVLGGAASSTDDRGVYRMTYLDPGRYYVAVLSVQATVPASVTDGTRVLPLGGLEDPRTSTPPVTAPMARGASIDADGRHRLVLTSFATPPPAGGSGPRAYPPVFYPNARTIAEAQLVEVPANGSAANVDVQLAPVAASTVSGRVSGATQNAANMVLRLMPQGSEHLSFGSEVATTVVEPDDTFTFLNVPRGDYTIVASSLLGEISAGTGEGRIPKSAGLGPVQGFSWAYPSVPNAGFLWWQTQGGSKAFGRMAVSVGGDATNLDFPLHETASVRGHVVVDDPTQMRAGEQFGLMLEPANADPSLGVFENYTTGEAHAFSMTGLRPVRYLLRNWGAGGAWRIKSAIANGVDLIDAGFDASAGQNFEDVVVTLTKTGALLTGNVHDRTGAPAVAAVILFPADAKLWVEYGLTPDRIRSVNTDSKGAYRFPPFRDGDYFVVAVPVSQSKAWIDPRFLAAASAHAARVTLSSTAPKTQDLLPAEVVGK